jgi:hypothetical protein
MKRWMQCGNIVRNGNEGKTAVAAVMANRRPACRFLRQARGPSAMTGEDACLPPTYEVSL